MDSYYVQKADELFPIFGANSLDEAKTFVDEADHGRVVQTHEEVYMNPVTGSVDFESGWDNLDEVVKVKFSTESESWTEE